MKRLILVFLLTAIALAACGSDPAAKTPAETNLTQSSSPVSESSTTQTSAQPTTVPQETESLETAPPQPGFFTKDGITYYRNEDGTLHIGWLNLDGKHYYMHADGSMAKGETVLNGRSFFFTATGEEIIIANPWNAIRSDYFPDLVEAENGYQVDRSCLDDLLQMLQDCRAAGFDAQITSAYRDHDTQVYLYDRKVNYYLDLGYSLDNARKEAGTVVAFPGTSEHQLGLAVDLVDSSYWVLDEAQENTPAQQWLLEHCWEYGFILRYPGDKSLYTGIIYEPWHYRYVGKAVAQELKLSGLCLEEYLNTLS